MRNKATEGSTDNMRANNAVVEAINDQRFCNIVNSSADGIIVTNEHGTIEFANPAAASMFGRSVSHLCGKPFSYSDMSSGGKTEIEVLQVNKAPLIAEMQVVKIAWNEQPAMLATLRDISEHIQLCRDLKRSNENLENFASVLSHDIKAPLRNISVLAGWLQKDHSVSLSHDAKGDVDILYNTAERMQKMVDGLLHYSRVSARQEKSKGVDLAAVLEDATLNLAEDIFRTEATIVNSNMPSIDCSTQQITILFQHILDNAMRYCSNQPYISIDARMQGENWVFSFKDNGFGIAKASLPNIFTPFNHLSIGSDDNSTSDTYGIGLAICKKIVDVHNGKIWLESEADQGSTVYVQLPARVIVTTG